MDIDLYSPCPGGTGKKIKFCCSDLTTELDKLSRMVSGEQRAAALEQVDKLDAKYPDRACLLATKAMLEAELGQPEKAAATLERFRRIQPDNPVALAETAILEAREKPQAAVDLLQRAIEHAGSQLPMQVYDALGAVGMALLAAGELTASRAHLMLQFGLSGGKDEQALRLIVQLQGSPEIHLLLKENQPLVEPPADAVWKAEFATALESGRAGRWSQAAAQFQALAHKAGAWPPIARNLALLESWLARRPEAVRAWQSFAVGEVPLDDAVEARATAMLLDDNAATTVDVLKVTYPVRDTDALLVQLAAHRQALRMPVDLRMLVPENEPPPKGYFSLLDRARPASTAGLTLAELPLMLGQVAIFGRQTDREARLELVAARPELAKCREVLTALAGDLLAGPGSEEISGPVNAVDELLVPKWYLPDEIPADQRRELLTAGHRQQLLSNWTELAQTALGGKTPRQAAADPQGRIAVLAAILILELRPQTLLNSADYNALRRELGLPEPGPIDPTHVSILELPYARLERLEVGKLSDHDLLVAFERAQEVRFMPAALRLGREIVGRPSLDKELDKAAVYTLLAQLERELPQARADLDAARVLAAAAGKSSARYDLVELAICMGQGDVASADRLLHHIRDEHLREPGIAQALYGLLAQWGLVRPDGSVAGEPAEAASGLVVPGAAAQPAGKLWTPGSEPAAAGQKSAIWTPGME